MLKYAALFAIFVLSGNAFAGDRIWFNEVRVPIPVGVDFFACVPLAGTRSAISGLRLTRRPFLSSDEFWVDVPPPAGVLDFHGEVRLVGSGEIAVIVSSSNTALSAQSQELAISLQMQLVESIKRECAS